ncbi:hypothetical protein SKAU_G00095350 [Synaphobranchus kaupii]|uniref:Uncharacterized protein n=1 Tax=Synaphobranchus kaupii TaxID=118154 RepID=A0A9Q1FXQ1_SYNKA|nr:hypothetical protein SKAU_G00095350 [Synaphobranchus kaupii]
MQPLDRTLFKSLKAEYNRAADSWMTTHPGKRFDVYQMAGLFSQAYNKAANVEKGVVGFRAYTPQPSTSAKGIPKPSQCPGDNGPDTESASTILLELSPRPRLQEARPRKRKAESATVLTASPNKRVLEETAKEKMAKAKKAANKRPMKRPAPSKKGKKENVEEGDAECIYCIY